MLKNTFLLFLLVLFTACGNEEQTDQSSKNGPPKALSKGTLPGSNGGRLDLIVVATEGIWQSGAGDAFRKVFTEAQYGLPQPESVFTVRQVTPSQFNSLLQRSRAIVFISKDEDEGFKMKANQWAKPQLVASFAAKDEASLRALIVKNRDAAFERFKDLEVRVLRDRMTKAGIQKNPEILKNHNISMQIPESFTLEQSDDNLMVFWNKTRKTDQGILIHFQPLTDEMNSIGTNVIPLRDSITKLYIHGQREGSYMATEMYIPPLISTTEVDGQFAVETRGLWRTEGDFMGGPFINYTVYDEKHKQIIFLDAFIYSPETKKRNFVLELEAILKTLKIS